MTPARVSCYELLQVRSTAIFDNGYVVSFQCASVGGVNSHVHKLSKPLNIDPHHDVLRVADDVFTMLHYCSAATMAEEFSDESGRRRE
eukprot:SAG11_NODE_1103_length_5862_cov_8.036439_4_plen_88_part_00